MVEQGHVGERNSRWALDALAREGVRVVGVDVGGNHYRRLVWIVGDGAPRVDHVAV
jgi:chemotaxis receptor (MCP) glutamine deamidase CheD